MEAIVEGLSQPPLSVDLGDGSIDHCTNPKCQLFGRAQFTKGRTACRAEGCKTPFKSIPAESVPFTPSAQPVPTFDSLQIRSRPSNDRQALGRKFRQLREEAGISQTELAKRIDTARSYISKIELGKCVPNLETCPKLANGLGIKTETLIERTVGAMINPLSLSSLGPFLKEMILLYRGMNKKGQDFLRWAITPGKLPPPTIGQLEELLFSFFSR